jgi:hypothetical protein
VILDDARARWRTNTIPHYRLRVTTDNPLMVTVTESDVRNGSVVVARGASGIPGLGARPGSRNWGPADGQTVEALFQVIEDALQRPDSVVSAVYDARRGYPTHIGTGPVAIMMDAGVSFTIELIESPPVPLVAPSPGEAFRSPWPARLVDLGVMYSTLFGFGSNAAERLVRRVWPNRGDEIRRQLRAIALPGVCGLAAVPIWLATSSAPHASQRRHGSACWNSDTTAGRSS